MTTLDSLINPDIRDFYETNLDESVYLFIDTLYSYLSVKEVKDVLLGTELSFLLDDLFGPTLNLGDFSTTDNVIVTAVSALRDSRETLDNMFFFYGGIYSDAGKRPIFEELKSVWLDHRNSIYQLAGLILLHVVGAYIVKENLC